jgi:MoaA/NifB/PqqE/SkfB family radical SAM enzyme
MNRSLYAAPNFHLVPVEDNGAGQKFEIVGNDPQLILLEECGGAELKLNPGRYMLTFCAHPADGKLKKPMLFLDTGHGFADTPNAKFMLYNDGLDTWSVSFEIDRAVERVRLDPSEGPACTFEIVELTITSAEPKGLSRSFIHETSRSLIETSPTFCVIPFVQAELTAHGGVKPCCFFDGFVSDRGKNLSVYQSSFEEIWNSLDLRSVRQKMVLGKSVERCAGCYIQERRSGSSGRTDANSRWRSFEWGNPRNEAPEDLVANALINDYRIPGGPVWLDFDLGNRCNLRCRMCNSHASSSISRDAVHSRWATFAIETPLRWRGREAVILPSNAVGIEYEGLVVANLGEDGSSRYEANGVALITVKNLDAAIASLRLKISRDEVDSATFRLFANDLMVADGSLGRETIDRAIPISAALNYTDEFVLRIECDSAITIEELTLLRADSGGRKIGSSRLARGKEWFQDFSFIQRELLRNPDRITKLQLVGGEPLLVKETRLLLTFLIDKGFSQNIDLHIVTNGTVFDRDVASMMTEFASSYIAFSIDGFDTLNEYIRHGSKWSDVDRNIGSFISTGAASAYYLKTTVQAYNMMHVGRIASYAESRGIGLCCSFLDSPEYLSCFRMPATAREMAVAKLRRYALGEEATETNRICRADLSKELLRVAEILENTEAAFDAAIIDIFMRFTSDLDASRGQNIKHLNNELVECLEPFLFTATADLSDGCSGKPRFDS